MIFPTLCRVIWTKPTWRRSTKKEAREEAGVDDWYLDAVRNGDPDVTDIWEEFEKQHQK